MQEDEIIHVPNEEETGEERVPGLGETAILPGGGITEGDAVPDMPPGSDMTDYRGGGLDATDTAQPTSTADTTGDRATGLTGLRGGGRNPSRFAGASPPSLSGRG